MTTLGLTGGIGSGKTAAAARLAEKPGVRIVFADDVAKRLMVEDPAVRDAVRQRFGAEAYREDGTLDRAHLASRVFGDEVELAALNAIVHPAVRRAMLAAIESARASGVRLLVYEAALIFETGADQILDHVAVVDAPEAVRIQRATARDGATPEAVRTRMARQMDPAEMRRRANSVLENGGPVAELHAQVDALYERLLSPEASPGASGEPPSAPEASTSSESGTMR
ncbi:dephospho-CoA kinase [Rubricoccus marinus]|uniref:Dephospho-CoA kinase n=1 Tax=Rubricoccus marinus TaxID=716817 RepID=A0A259TVY2_9BACT|nr:dephospho-CoA kinase [Rubricoccus marinus]OZC01925.1 dephospho-CoA kinase [Rubricoccus marinus]